MKNHTPTFENCFELASNSESKHVSELRAAFCDSLDELIAAFMQRAGSNCESLMLAIAISVATFLACLAALMHLPGY